MGFLVAYSRKMYLTAYINKLQVKIKDITEQKLKLTDTITEYQSQINDIGDADSPSVKKLKAKMVEIENLEKQADLQAQKYQTQLSAAQTELNSADSAVQSGIQSSFSVKYA